MTTERAEFRRAFDDLADHYENVTGRRPQWVRVYGHAFRYSRLGMRRAWLFYRRTKWQSG